MCPYTVKFKDCLQLRTPRIPSILPGQWSHADRWIISESSIIYYHYHQRVLFLTWGQPTRTCLRYLESYR